MVTIASTASGGFGYEETCPAYSSHLPQVFGPPLWWMLHTTAATFPVNPDPLRRSECVSFLSSLPSMIPCASCGDHLRKELEKRDLHAACAGKESLSQMWCEVHNVVNVRTGKPLMDCSGVVKEYDRVPICNPWDVFS
jgi:FAD-linked sulfhydryl oxidase